MHCVKEKPCIFFSVKCSEKVFLCKKTIKNFNFCKIIKNLSKSDM